MQGWNGVLQDTIRESLRRRRDHHLMQYAEERYEEMRARKAQKLARKNPLRKVCSLAFIERLNCALESTNMSWICNFSQALTGFKENRADRQRRRKRADRAINKMLNQREGRIFEAWLDWAEVRLPFLYLLVLGVSSRICINAELENMNVADLQNKNARQKKAKHALKHMERSCAARTLNVWQGNLEEDKHERGLIWKALKFVSSSLYLHDAQ